MRGRPSPWFVVAVAALVAALAGTAIAGPSAITDKLTKSKVKRIANKQIAKAAPGLSVKHADTAGRADTADSATRAATADEATHAASATNADSALNATNAVNAASALNATNAQNAVAAESVDGYSIKPMYFAATANGESATILELEGLTLTATCFFSAPNVIDIQARTAVNNTSLIATNFASANPVTASDNNFDSGAAQALFPSSQGIANASFEWTTPAAAGQTRGAIVSGSLQILNTTALGGTKACLLSGTAMGIPAG